MRKLLFEFVIVLMLAGTAWAGDIKLVESNAWIDEGKLFIEIMFINTSDSMKNVLIKMDYFGQQDTRNEIIPSETTKKVDYVISNFSEGKVKLVASADEDYFLVIDVPPDWENGIELQIKQVTSLEEFDATPTQRNPVKEADSFLKNSFGRDYWIFAGILSATCFLAFIAIKTLFKKKTPAEKTKELTSEMLTEIEKIEKMRKKN